MCACVFDSAHAPSTPSPPHTHAHLTFFVHFSIFKQSSEKFICVCAQHSFTICIHACILTYIHAYMHACMHACMCIEPCSPVSVMLFPLHSIHTYIHTYIHTCIYTLFSSDSDIVSSPQQWGGNKITVCVCVCMHIHLVLQ